MNNLALSLGSLIVGVIATVWASAYYFRRSMQKSLTPYIQFASSPFKGIDEDVRKSLKITYRDIPIDDLFEIQFLIANTGDKAIRDLIEPLALSLPDGCELLDASLLHTNPQELKVSLEVSDDRRSFKSNFPLLNSGDFFVVKALMNGEADTKALKFSILVDELPRAIQPIFLGPGEIGTSEKRSIEFSLLAAGLVITLFGLTMFKVIYDAWPAWPSINAGFSVFLSQFTWGAVATWLAVFPSFLFTLLGAMMTGASLFDGSFPPKKRKFVLPEGLAKSRFRVVVRDGEPPF